MDDNTFKAVLAGIACVQVVALAFFARQQGKTATRLSTVHELVNGLAHEKDTAIASAAQKEGEMRGRAWALANPPTTGVQSPAVWPVKDR